MEAPTRLGLCACFSLAEVAVKSVVVSRSRHLSSSLLFPLSLVLSLFVAVLACVSMVFQHI